MYDILGCGNKCFLLCINLTEEEVWTWMNKESCSYIMLNLVNVPSTFYKHLKYFVFAFKILSYTSWLLAWLGHVLHFVFKSLFVMFSWYRCFMLVFSCTYISVLAPEPEPVPKQPVKKTPSKSSHTLGGTMFLLPRIAQS